MDKVFSIFLLCISKIEVILERLSPWVFGILVSSIVTTYMAMIAAVTLDMDSGPFRAMLYCMASVNIASVCLWFIHGALWLLFSAFPKEGVKRFGAYAVCIAMVHLPVFLFWLDFPSQLPYYCAASHGGIWMDMVCSWNRP